MTQGLYQEFSKRLIDTMKAKGYNDSRSPKGISIPTLAQFAGASEQICRRYVRGDALPDYERVIKIAESLQISPGWLLFGEQNESGMNFSISEDLLYYIIQKSHTLFQHDPHSSDDFPDFVLELIRDVKGVNTDMKNLKKTIDIALKSICSYKEKQNKRLAK